MRFALRYAGENERTARTSWIWTACAAEIDHHLNRGRNMDTRTPASECRFFA